MKWTRILTIAWMAGICLLYGIHLLHLRADFPNFSPWMDYSKYTDEGWYGSAAIRHFLTGSWRLPGDFNPAAALPVWPLLEGIVFRFTGVSLVAARVLVLIVFAGNLLLTYALLRTRTQQEQSIALLGATIAASSAFLYAFSRLAILEPLLIFWMLLSWLLALYLPKASSTQLRYALLTAIGFLMCLQILTKTTAIFLIPSTIYLLWFAAQHKLSASLKYAGVVAASAIVPWSAYYFLAVRPHFLADYHYLFAANKWDQPTTIGGWIAAFWYAMHGTLWIDTLLCLLASASCCFFRSVWLRNLWSNPLFVASLLAAAGYIFFIGWHNNMQPRYYEVVAFPLIIVVTIGTASLLEIATLVGRSGLAIIVISIGLNLRLIAHFMRHTDHTFYPGRPPSDPVYRPAPQRQPYAALDQRSQHHASSRICLRYAMTSAPTISPTASTPTSPDGTRHGTRSIPGTLEDLHTQYSLQRVARYHAFDDEDRNVLILYKLIPLPPNKRHYDADLEAKANEGK